MGQYQLPQCMKLKEWLRDHRFGRDLKDSAHVFAGPAHVRRGSLRHSPHATCRPAKVGRSPSTARWPRSSPMRRHKQSDAFYEPRETSSSRGFLRAPAW
jgi:hypothetical protein